MASPNNNELLRQIALLSGAIDQHKSGHSSPVPYTGYARGRGKGIFSGRGRGRGGSAHFPQRAYGNMKLVSNTTPIKVMTGSTGLVGVRETTEQKQVDCALSPAGSGWKASDNERKVVAALPDERNTNNNQNFTMGTPKSGINSALSAALSTPPSASGWITKRTGKNMQLISKAVLPTIAAVHAQTQRTVQAKKQRKAAILASLKTERLREFKKAKSEFLKQGKTVHVGGVSYIKSRSGNTLVAAAPVRKKTVIINGVGFIMDPTGRKLVRKVEDPSGGVASANFIPKPLPPKRLNISGDLFVRTKKGNLVRAPSSINTTPARRYAPSVAITGSRKQHTIGGSQPKTYCQFYNRFGKCKKGYLCQYLHDPKRIALCTRHLKDACPHAASECTFSHLLIPEKVPLCTHFARGNCSKANCRYLHSKVSSTADICRSFALENYCENGARCKNRHIMECPDFAKGGKTSCPDSKKCRLFHNEKGTKRKRSVDEHATEADYTARRLDAGTEPLSKTPEPQEDEGDDMLFPDFESQEGDIDEQVFSSFSGSSESNTPSNEPLNDDDEEVLMIGDYASGEESANQKDDEKEYDTDELIYDEDEDEDEDEESEADDVQIKTEEDPITYRSDEDFVEEGDDEYGFGANYMAF